jgi:hypothetical protein
VKKWGDGKEQPYDQFKDEISPNNKGETTPWLFEKVINID